MTTYQQQFEIYHLEFAEKSSAYIKAEKKITYSGFGDTALMDDFLFKRKEFEIAGNNYHNFLAYCKKVNAKPNDVFKA